MEQINFNVAVQRLKDTTYKPMPSGVQIKIPDAQRQLANGLKFFCGDKARWNSGYDKIASWLSDNKTKGLMLVGDCGLGKSLIGMRIIPLLLSHYCQRVVTVCTVAELNKAPDEIMAHHIIYVDDVGTEDISNNYGNRRIPFAELVDAAERNGKLLMFSTNLNDTLIEQKRWSGKSQSPDNL